MEYSKRDIQNKLLEIIKDFDEFCKINEIEYFLMGGSALGAMRHKGFIPWDDDFDVFMTYDNYHKFLSLFKDSDKYHLHKENTKEWPLFLSQIRLNGTTFISNEWKNNRIMNHGLFIDIMCLYKAPKSNFKRKVQYFNAMLLKVNALHKMHYPCHGCKRIALFLSPIIVNKLTRKLIFHNVKKYNNKDVEMYGHFFGRARFRFTSFPKEYVGKIRYEQFEDLMLPVMEKVEDYLVVRYGNKWNEIPDQKTKDMYPDHGAFVDLDKDFREYGDDLFEKI